jgi:hypothetical protein
MRTFCRLPLEARSFELGLQLTYFRGHYAMVPQAVPQSSTALFAFYGIIAALVHRESGSSHDALCLGVSNGLGELSRIARADVRAKVTATVRARLLGEP